MKTFVFSIAIITVLSACNNNDPKEKNKTADSLTTNAIQDSAIKNMQSASVDDAIKAYLNLKNALSSDNGREAADAGKDLQVELIKLNNASLDSSQKKVYDDVKEDMVEHAEHISTNAKKIEHQREHFDILSKDMYDIVKAIKPSQTLYKIYCPMYNDKKGAIWLSEVKEIKNPYYGKKMLTCGEQHEEINNE